jgi:RHS repeat-associated protein
VTNAGSAGTGIGVADTYTFSTLQGVPKATTINRAWPGGTPAAATESFGYDSNGYMNSKTDWNGNQTTITNNAQGNPTTINEGIVGSSSPLRTTTIGYGASSGACTTFVHLPCTITTPGDTITFTYDGSGDVATKTETDTTTGSTPYSTNGMTRTWTLTWGTGANVGLLHTVTGPRTDLTQTTTFAYPATGSNTGTLTSITDPLSHVTSFTYGSSGGTLPLTITDPNGVVTTLAYDTRLNLNTSKLDPTGSAGGPYTTTYTHDAANNLTQVTLPDSSYLQYGYDTANRLTSVTNALGESIQYTLDALGDRYQTYIYDASSTLTRKHTATFDNLGRMLTDLAWTTTSASNTTTLAYDPNSNVTSITDPRSHTTGLSYDALNRLTTVTDRLSHTTTAAYDAHDAITSVIDPNGYTTTYTRDGFERAKQLTSPDSGTSVYQYDLADNLTQKTDGAGVVTTRTFDAVNRELTRTFSSTYAAEDVYNTYDQTGAFGFGIGHLTTMSNATTVGASLYTRYIAYDERGNDIGGADVYGGGAYTFNNYKYYDGASRLTAIINPSGWAQGWSRDAAGQVTGVAIQPSPYTSSPTLVAGTYEGSGTTPITHLPFGPVASIPFANGVTRTNTYDLDYKLTNLSDTGTSSVLDLDYAYDANSNVTCITDHVNAANSQIMTYDYMDRTLTAASGASGCATGTGGGYGSYVWTWDSNGNRTSETLNGGTTDTYSYPTGSGANNQVIATSASGFALTYNGAGATLSVSQYGSTLFNSAWNQSEQQASVTLPGGSTLASYSYDGNGDRIVKTAAVATVFFHGAARELTEETNANPQTTDYIYLDPSSRRDAYTPVGMIAIPSYPLSSSTALYFVHTDRLGTPQKVTDTSSPPVVQWSTTYTPFGATQTITNTNTNNITQNLRLPGMYADPETGLYHNGAREYVPTTGLYFKTDPIGLAGGTATYQYAFANPFKYTDPKGLWPEGPFGIPLFPNEKAQAQKQLPAFLQKVDPSLTQDQISQLSDDIIEQLGTGDLDTMLALRSVKKPCDLTGDQVQTLNSFLDTLPTRDQDAVNQLKNILNKLPRPAPQ